MARRLPVWALCVLGLAMLALAAACGGGEEADPGAGKGAGIKDPAKVPSSTPIKEPILFKITGDTISTTGAEGSATVPGGGTPTSGSKTKYTVKSGDTCGAIATAHNITVDQLLKANRTVDAGCTNLHEGDVLTIPQSASATTTTGGGSTPVPTGTVKPGGKSYTVQKGDTCADIAASYGVDVGKLISLNGLDANCQNLQVGQTLQIPQ